MKTSTRSLMAAILCTAFLALGATAAEPEAKELFYEPTKALFGAGSGSTTIRPETEPGQDFTSQTSGGLGGLTGFYDKLENPGVMYYIELVQPGSNTVKRVSNNRIFKSGEKIRIRVTTNGDGYVHALHKGTTGGNKMLPVSANGQVRTGHESVIPSDGGWLRFDDNKGIEKIEVVFSGGSGAAAAGGAMPAVAPETLVQKVQATVDQYGRSKSLVAYTESGEKDLVVEGGAGGAAVASAPVSINRMGAANFSVPAAVSAAPGSYVINTASEPVVLNVQLEHQ